MRLKKITSSKEIQKTAMALNSAYDNIYVVPELGMLDRLYL
jgi:hypothetical protein